MRRVLLAFAALSAASCFQAVTEAECLRDTDCDAGRCFDGVCASGATGGGNASGGGAQGGGPQTGGGVGTTGGGQQTGGGQATGGGAQNTGGGATGGGNAGGAGGGTNNCTGCTSPVGCQPGDSVVACGSGGNQCTTCNLGEQCVNGACVMTACGPQSCNGCCLQGVCVPPSSQSGFACGAAGAMCTQCPQGAACTNGSCQMSNCAATCNGCCDGAGQCRNGGNALACGSGGAMCQLCPQGSSCNNGTCTPVVGTDGGTTVHPAGSPCTSTSQCQPPQNGQCIPETLPSGQSTGYTGGYCTRSCGGAAGGCGGNAVCITDIILGTSQSTCRQRCGTSTSTPCRTGYVCQTTVNGDSYCRANCNNGGLLSACGQNQTCTAAGTCQ